MGTRILTTGMQPLRWMTTGGEGGSRGDGIGAEAPPTTAEDATVLGDVVRLGEDAARVLGAEAAGGNGEARAGTGEGIGAEAPPTTAHRAAAAATETVAVPVPPGGINGTAGERFAREAEAYHPVRRVRSRRDAIVEVAVDALVAGLLIGALFGGLGVHLWHCLR